APPPGLESALGARPRKILAADHYIALLDDENQVREIEPDLARLAGLGPRGVAVTAASREADFVSRFFAPGLGIPEDPVTGSVHRSLVPFWSQQLGKDRLIARQVSRRGGLLRCRLAGDRVTVAGRCWLYLEGTINVPDETGG
ncbi:MAG: PhzF family phenazine biosynthesis protein, partial [Candidatus Dadabacteria bacterium]